MNQQEIDNVVVSVLSDQIQEFEIIVSHYQKQLLKYVRYLSNSNCDVEDTVQEIFIRIYKNLHKYQLGTSFNNWVYRIAFNHTMNTLKKRNRNKILLFGNLPEIPVTFDVENETSLRTKHALSKLTIDERNLLYFRVYEDMNYKKLANILESSETILRKRFERIKKKFIKAYGKEITLDEERTIEITDIRLYK